MQKIAILISSMGLGGAERVVSVLLEELSQYYDVTLILMDHTIRYRLPENQKILYLDNAKKSENNVAKLIKIPYLAFKYQKLCKEHALSTTLSFLNRPNYIALISKLFGNPSRIIAHERSYPSLQHRIGLQGFINRLLIRILYPFSDLLVTNSLGNAQDLKKHFKIDQSVTIFNPFSIEAIKQLSHGEVDLPQKRRFTFITVGRLDLGKNHQLIFDAIAQVDADLWIIGEGPLRSSLEDKCITLNIKDRVKFLGHQSNPFSWMAHADCFVFSSNHEGFPNVLVEALSCGLPIISTDCHSGPREILSPLSNPYILLNDSMEIAEYGILVPTNDPAIMQKAMHLIMYDEIKRNTYKTKSHLRAKDFEKSKIIKDYLSILKQLT